MKINFKILHLLKINFIKLYLNMNYAKKLIKNKFNNKLIKFYIIL